MRQPSLPFLLLALACRAPETAIVSQEADNPGQPGPDTGVDPPDSGAPDGDSGDTDPPDTGDSGTPDTGGDTGDPDPNAPVWCLEFESGDLRDVGELGTEVETWNGGRVFNVIEGQNFSALLGEEDLDFGGEHALAMRSSHDGNVESYGVATTLPFEITHAQLGWWQLSEVDGDGIEIEAEVLLADDHSPLGNMWLPVETGGFVPALLPEHEPIEGHEEITYGAATPGQMVHQVTDVSDFVGQTAKLRFVQHTKVGDNGFFTLIDDICHGDALEADPAALLAWAPTPALLRLRGPGGRPTSGRALATHGRLLHPGAPALLR